MNTLVQMLAQTQSANPNPVEGVPPDQSVPPQFFTRVPIDNIWDFIVNISWLQAVVCIAFGAIYLIYGWRVFKVLVIINFAVLGMYAGINLGGRLGSGPWGGIMGCAIAGICSWPFMKYGVSILGALAGAVLGAAFWRVMTLPDPLIWCGALAGLVAGGLLAFSSFKTSILLFTSLQGSVFVVVGVLALLCDYPELTESVTNAVYQHVFLLPGLLLIPTLGGILCQAKLQKIDGYKLDPSFRPAAS